MAALGGALLWQIVPSINLDVFVKSEASSALKGGGSRKGRKTVFVFMNGLVDTVGFALSGRHFTINQVAVIQKDMYE